jgi:hypothetical protein
MRVVPVLIVALLVATQLFGGQTREILIFNDAGMQYALSCSSDHSTSPIPLPVGAMIFLVYTPSERNVDYRKQSKLINGSESFWEDFQLLYVTASPTFERRDAYYVRSTEAKQLTDAPTHFSALVIDSHCRRVFQAAAPITAAELVAAVRRSRGAASNNRLEQRVVASVRGGAVE